MFEYDLILIVLPLLLSYFKFSYLFYFLSQRTKDAIVLIFFLQSIKYFKNIHVSTWTIHCHIEKKAKIRGTPDK